MKTVAVNGYKSYIGKNFHKYYKKKYKIIYYKDDINNLSKFKLFVKKNKLVFKNLIYGYLLNRDINYL